MKAKDGGYEKEMAKFIQINLYGAQAAQYLLKQMAKEMNCCIKERRKAQRARKKRHLEEQKRIDTRTPESCSETPSSKARGDVDRDPWDMPYRLVMWKLRTKQGSGAPTDVPTVLKIVEALFPNEAPRESYLSYVALDVPLFQISGIKLAASEAGIRKGPGSRRHPQRSSKSDYSEEA